MYEIHPIQKPLVFKKYKKLTFPLYRYLLEQPKNNESTIVAVGASYQDFPVGLALAQVKSNSAKAEILSIYVEPLHRNCGIGKALLKLLEENLFLHRCTKARLVYMTGKDTTPAFESLLVKSNWDYPRLRMLVSQTTVKRLLAADWLQKYSQLPSSYSIVSWQEITPRELEVIKTEQQLYPWIPQDLIPFKYEKDFEPITSLGLRYQGQVVGWAINQLIAPDTLRTTCSFIKKDLQKMGRSVALYAEVAKRCLKLGNPEHIKLIWGTPLNHKSMINFTRRRFKPYLTSFTETRESFKNLETLRY